MAAHGGLRRARPLVTKFFCAADDAFDEIAGRQFLCGGIGSGAVRRNFKQLEFFENGFHGAVCVTEELRAADVRKDPAHALENRLAVQNFRKFFERMITVTIGLAWQSAVRSFDAPTESEPT